MDVARRAEANVRQGRGEKAWRRQLKVGRLPPPNDLRVFTGCVSVPTFAMLGDRHCGVPWVLLLCDSGLPICCVDENLMLECCGQRLCQNLTADLRGDLEESTGPSSRTTGTGKPGRKRKATADPEPAAAGEESRQPERGRGSPHRGKRARVLSSADPSPPPPTVNLQPYPW